MDKIKVAISAKKDGLDSEISDFFGRSPYFIVAEITGGEIEKTEIIENKSTDQIGGAGISTAQLMAEKNINAVITGNVGPRASEVLRQFNIAVYYGEGSVKKSLQEFIDGNLKKNEK